VQPAVARSAAVTHAHPLDPLSAAEISRSSALFRADSRFPKDGIFPILDLLEPSKEEVLAWKPGTAMPRRVQAVV
jgi:primary-amine oxidase